MTQGEARLRPVSYTTPPKPGSPEYQTLLKEAPDWLKPVTDHWKKLSLYLMQSACGHFQVMKILWHGIRSAEEFSLKPRWQYLSFVLHGTECYPLGGPQPTFEDAKAVCSTYLWDRLPAESVKS